MSETTPVASGVMQHFVAQTPEPLQEGQIVEGIVSAIGRARVYIDVLPHGTGIIYGREYMNARDILRKVSPGDTIASKVVTPENEDGYIELSIKEAKQALVWSEAQEAMSSKAKLELVVKEANKGGLMLNWQGVSGFLPA